VSRGTDTHTSHRSAPHTAGALDAGTVAVIILSATRETWRGHVGAPASGTRWGPRNAELCGTSYARLFCGVRTSDQAPVVIKLARDE
jgi:hypothetical protein